MIHNDRFAPSLVVWGSALALICFAFLVLGAVSIGIDDVAAVLVNHLTPFKIEQSAPVDAIVWNIRMPRLILAASAGIALGVGGVTLQGTYRNPIADPQLVGLSSIASIGAITGFWLGYATVGPEIAIAAGAVAGVLGGLVVRHISGRAGGDAGRFILIGIALGLVVGAVVATASVAIHDPRIPDISFWFFGGLGAATWSTAAWVFLAAILALAALLPSSSRLDILSLGFVSARHVGLNVSSVLRTNAILVGGAVGATVGAIGVVGFVGLVAGRIAAKAVGPHHRHTIPMAATVGATFVVGSDLIGRVVGHGFEVPVGLITTAVGGVYLVYLILRNRVAA
jgi:iron complex transport system permease protein